jgi:hypothetical protein
MLNNETIVLLLIILLGVYSLYTSKESFTSGGVFQQLYAKDQQDDYLTSNHKYTICKNCGFNN